jgi:iron complex outermembrane recepter protein
MDRFTLYGGNPFLRPTFSQNFELSYTLNNAITLTAQYSLTKDVINETIEQGANIFYSRPGNIGQQISYGVSLNGTLQPYKWWTLQWYVEFTHNDFDALLYGQRLKNKGTYGYFAPTSIFQAGKGWSAEHLFRTICIDSLGSYAPRGRQENIERQGRVEARCE